MTRSLLASMVALIASVPAFANDLKITVSFTEAYEKALPGGRSSISRISYEIRVSPNGKIMIQSMANSGGQSRFREADTKLGSGDDKLFAVRALSKNKIAIYRAQSSFTRTIIISHKEGACSAEFTYALKPGAKFFTYWTMRDNREISAERVTASDVRCTIGTVAT